jgi:ParB family chromosome partitioning protein
MSHEQIQHIPLSRIKTADQVRKVFDKAVIAAMAESLRTIGQLQPIRVRRVEAGAGVDEHYYLIVDGELRVRGATLPPALQTLAAIIEGKDLSDGEIIHRQLIANCHRDNLKPVEKARAIVRLMKETGWSATQTAAKLVIPDASLSRLLSLLKLSDDLLKQIDAGQIAESAAAELARIEDPARRAELAAQLVKGEITRDGLSGIRKRERKPANSESITAISRVTAQLGNGRVVTLSGSGLHSLDVMIQWLEDLLAKARKARPQGLAIETFSKMLRDQAKAE